jgi:hypothetical protein
MKKIILLGLLLCAAGTASAYDRNDRESVAFGRWLANITAAIDFPQPLGDIIRDSKEPWELKISFLGREIANDGRLLARYLNTLEGYRQKHGRTGKYDRSLVGSIKSHLGWIRRDFDRVDRLAEEFGIKISTGSAEGRLTKYAQPKAGDERYQPESGLWEVYDADTKTWKPQETAE